MGEQTCPQCGADMPVDEGYPVWCAGCDFNVAPELFVYGLGGTARLRREVAGQHAVAVFEELAREGTRGRRARRTPAYVLSYALALLVHGLSFAVLGAGVWLLVGGGVLGTAAGIPLVALFLVLRPRFPRLRPAVARLDRQSAPRLFRLVDSVAREVGTRSVDAIVVDPSVNAAVTTYGLRQRVLHLGLGLWSVLSPQEKVALLGHELGHYAGGDTRHGSLVGGALRTLWLWERVLAPRGRWTGLLLGVPHRLAQSALTLLEKVTLRGFPRREYLADDLAAEVASTEAAVRLMETLFQVERIGDTLREQAAQGGDALWRRLAERVASVPPRERERLRRVSALEWHQQDATHPPTHLRAELLCRRGSSSPRVVLDRRTDRAIDRELLDQAAGLARALAREARKG
ncbi:M48 family metallopeptidase [Streptomyces sp. NPDC047072]|uniref:M48 family metallopeptidase n=1 Tax=Streptomyces sp. NPDC047072 TaxID=3154809 RepID=UPI0033E3A194